MKANTEVYHIYFDPTIDAVVMEWDGYSTSNQFKEGTELMLNTLIRNNAQKVLADTKDMIIIGMEDQKWLEKDFLPRALQFGFKAIAIVKSDHYFNRVAVESVSYRLNNEKLTISLFDEVEEAKKWLAGFQ